ncbi:BgTH12-04591 [Blumeria graminis f. sp. triticale]|uniref:lipoyl(octanoyl) transferase n=3 Tax=Blumeria graminis TaxID=34373 RepID=A0A381L3Y0_BLUGR|nr:Lipoyl ligase [Blumeria graminis f. sp. tritici 96224]CAD6498935.1 BgTH12-04591 [Blumeria graminis f. sp. triticale]VCU39056.1 Bgt-5326 [Blumeria graminis f. sp. tritici]
MAARQILRRDTMAAKTPSSSLRHVWLRRPIQYDIATSIQNHVAAQHLDYKASLSSSAPLQNPSQPPLPTILTFTTSPVYTLGRRDSLASLPKSTVEALISPMPGIPGDKRRSNTCRAFIHEAQRGGQTTFHGPGQLLIWPIIDLKAAWPGCGPMDVRSYVRLLENCTIRSLSHFGCQSRQTRHPGIWECTGQKKIAALGVHLRRNISSYGVACNLSTDLRFYDRIVACGLKGKGTTSVNEVTGKNIDPAKFANVWVSQMASLLYGQCLDSASTPAEPRVQNSDVEELGLPPEITRMIWYMNVPRSVVKWTRKIKKVDLSDMNIRSEMPVKCEKNDSGNELLKDLLEMNDQNEAISRPSFRKCAGIGRWSPPIGPKGSLSVVRKIIR